jgi:hypothetical protein
MRTLDRTRSLARRAWLQRNTGAEMTRGIANSRCSMDTEQLLDRVARGESTAAAMLMTRHADGLRRMVHLRFDPRLVARMSTLIESGQAVDLSELTRDCPHHRPAARGQPPPGR